MSSSRCWSSDSGTNSSACSAWTIRPLTEGTPHIVTSSESTTSRRHVAQQRPVAGQQVELLVLLSHESREVGTQEVRLPQGVGHLRDEEVADRGGQNDLSRGLRNGAAVAVE